MSHICMAAWKIPRAFCPHPGPPKLTNQFDHVGEIWFSHDWSHSEIPHPLPRSLLIHGGFCMETPDIATKEFHSKGLGVGNKNMGCSKPRALKGKTLCWNLYSGNDVVRWQFFRNCVQEISRSFLSIMPVWVVDLEFRSFYQGVILQMKGREDDRSIIYRSIKGCRPKVETPIWSLQITCP